MIKHTPQEALKYVQFPMEVLDNEWATSSDAVVYAFMLNRYLFFKNIGKEYYENIVDIAKGSRQDISTVKRSIKKLSQHGYISISKIKAEVGVSNNYKVNDLHQVYNPVRSKSKDSDDSYDF